MLSILLYKGYDEGFIAEQNVPLPVLSDEQSEDLVLDEEGSEVIKYINYSLQQSASHKFPFYTAANIDGLLFKKVPRRDNWRKDKRIHADSQFGRELYGAAYSDFDRGHMTKREDVQWGKTIGIASNAADSTFYYTNAVPQHKDLNQEIWKRLEDYILHTETKQNELRVCVFTGPVLTSENPYFVTPVRGEKIQLPVLFWKIVVYPKNDGKLYRVGFMMSQNKLLQNDNIVEYLESGIIGDELFMQFDDAATYQVNISLIEELSGLTFPAAIDSYTDERSTRLVLEEIDIDPDLESFSAEYELGFSIQNMKL